jgi:ribonuclease VapC
VVSSRVVLDASAVLALLNGEPGHEVVAEAIPEAVLSAVNLSEVVAKLGEKGMPEEAITTAMAGLEMEILPFDEASAYETARLRAPTKSLGLSLGDRACLALGRRLSLPVLTADKDWRKVDIDLEVRVIR